MAVGTVPWRYQGQLSVTVVVKATFRLVDGGVMKLVAAEPIRAVDEYADGAPPSSLCGVRETSPQLQQAEVVLFGSAYAPLGRDGRRTAVTERTVRLRVGRAQQPLVDKALLVVGDVYGEEPPIPFERIPICYERALGGPGFADNPLGVGLGWQGDRAPNLLSVEEPSRAAACYGPVPAFFPTRDRRRGSWSCAALDGGSADIASDFDWSYFQAAPADQRLSSFGGGEWVELTGLCPYCDVLRSELPRARAVTAVFGCEQANVPSTVPLVADQLILEPEELRCTLVWRGSFPIASRAAWDELVVAGALEIPGQSVRWPRSRHEALALGAPPPLGGQADLTSAFQASPPMPEPRGVAGTGVPPVGDDAGSPVALRTGFLDTSEIDVFQRAVRSFLDRRSGASASRRDADSEATRVLPARPTEPAAGRPTPVVATPDGRPSEASSSAVASGDPEQDQPTAVRGGSWTAVVEPPAGVDGRGDAGDDPDETMATAVMGQQPPADDDDPQGTQVTALRTPAMAASAFEEDDGDEAVPTRVSQGDPAGDVEDEDRTLSRPAAAYELMDEDDPEPTQATAVLPVGVGDGDEDEDRTSSRPATADELMAEDEADRTAVLPDGGDE